MSYEIYAGHIGDVRLAGASKGVACTTVPAFTSLHKGTNWVSLTTRNYAATAVVCQVVMAPYLVILKTTDDFATQATEYSQNGQDANAATVVDLSSISTAANGDYLYVGSHVPFRGAHCTILAGNDNASVLTVKYWKDATTDAWADISDTDGTDSAGDSMKQSGTVSWTVPSDWKLQSLRNIGDTTVATNTLYSSKLFWTRWEWTAALDSTTTINQMVAMNASTAYAEYTEGQALEFRIKNKQGGIGGVESRTDAGTCNLLVNCATAGTGDKFQ